MFRDPCVEMLSINLSVNAEHCMWAKPGAISTHGSRNMSCQRNETCQNNVGGLTINLFCNFVLFFK